MTWARRVLGCISGQSASLHALGCCSCYQSLCSTQRVLPLPKSPAVPIPIPLVSRSPKSRSRPWLRWAQLCPHLCSSSRRTPHSQPAPAAPPRPTQPRLAPDPFAEHGSRTAARLGLQPGCTRLAATHRPQSTLTAPVLGQGTQGCVGSLCSHRSPLYRGPCAS